MDSSTAPQSLQPFDPALLPGPLFDLLQRHERERDPLRRTWLLIDTLEWVVKWHTILCVSDLLREANLSPRMKVLLSSGLRTPSLGMWNMFFREAMKGIRNPSLPWDQWQRLTAMEERHGIVRFRNRYAHGATPENEQCERDHERYHPVLLELLASPLLSKVALQVSGLEGVLLWQGADRRPCGGTLEPSHVGACLTGEPDRTLLDLSPLAFYLQDKDTIKPGRHFFFFSALRNERIENICYEPALSQRERELWEPFHARLPLGKWAEAVTPELETFRARVDALTEVFKGRLEMRATLRDFCQQGRGTLVLWGGPGIGKSALLAQVFREVRAGVDSDGERLQGDFPPLVEYFIRRGEGRDDPVSFLRYLCQRLDRIYGLKGMGMGSSLDEWREALERRLQALEDREGEAERLVLFVDGLDEGLEILPYIPQARSWLAVLAAGRETEEVRAFYMGRDAGTRDETRLGPLGSAEVRALVHDVVDKYDPDLTTQYLDAVQERSQGNPLYLRLLCEQLFSGERRPGEAESLPRQIGELYEEVLDRITRGGHDEDALRLLYLLAEARTSLSVSSVGAFLNINEQRARSAVNACMEVLYEDPMTPEVDDYQLFHESLREWLRANRESGCRAAQRRLADACCSWKDLEGEAVLHYALEFGAAHLRAGDDHERLWELLSDEEYRSRQAEELGHFGACYAAMQHGIEVHAARGGKTPEDDARLCWLALRAARFHRETHSALDRVFDQVRDGPIDDLKRIQRALDVFKVLEAEAFFKASLKLMWIGADRQGAVPAASRCEAWPRLILNSIEERLADRSEEFAWCRFISETFMAWWASAILRVWPGLDLEPLYSRTYGLEVALGELHRSTADILGELELSNSVGGLCKDLARKLPEAEGAWSTMLAKGAPDHRGLEELTVDRIANLDDQALVDLVSYLAVEGDVEVALEVAENVTKDFYSSIALAHVAAGFARVSLVERAVELLENATAFAYSTANPTYRRRALLESAKAAVLAGDRTLCESLLSEVVALCEGTWGAAEAPELLAGCVQLYYRAGLSDQAADACKTVLEHVGRLDDAQARSRALSALTVAAAHGPEGAEAYRLFRGVLEVSVESVVGGDASYTCDRLLAVGWVLIKQGDLNGATQLVEGALKAAQEISSEQGCFQALGSIVSAVGGLHSASHHSPELEALRGHLCDAVHGLQDSGSRYKLARNMDGQGTFRAALRGSPLMEGIATAARDTEGANAWIQDENWVFIASGWLEQALERVQRMTPNVFEDEDIGIRNLAESRKHALNLIISEFGTEAQERDRLLEVIGSTLDGEIRSLALGVFARLCVDDGDWDRAVLAAESIGEAADASSALRYASVALARLGDLDHAQEVAKRIKTVPERVTAACLAFYCAGTPGQAFAEVSTLADDSRVVALNAIAAEVAASGTVDDALTGAAGLKRATDRVLFLSTVSSEFAVNDRPDLALVAAMAIEEACGRDAALALIGKSRSDAEDWSGALAAIQAMVDRDARKKGLAVIVGDLDTQHWADEVKESKTEINEEWTSHSEADLWCALAVSFVDGSCAGGDSGVGLKADLAYGLLGRAKGARLESVLLSLLARAFWDSARQEKAFEVARLIEPAS